MFVFPLVQVGSLLTHLRHSAAMWLIAVLCAFGCAESPANTNPIGVSGVLPDLKVVFAYDGRWQDSLPAFTKAIEREFGTTPVKIVPVPIPGESFSDDDVTRVLSHRPHVVFSGRPGYLTRLGQLRNGEFPRRVWLTGGPWVRHAAESAGDGPLVAEAKIEIFASDSLRCIRWVQAVAPSVKRIGVIAWAGADRRRIEQLADSIRPPGTQISVHFSANPAGTAALLRQSRALGVEAWYIPHAPSSWSAASETARAALEARVPTVFDYSHYYTQSGGLLSCAVQVEFATRVAQAARLLGAAAYDGEGRVFGPSFLSISINLDTLNALGLTLSPELRRRVDKQFRGALTDAAPKAPLAEGKQK
jgi:hypothetical protein